MAREVFFRQCRLVKRTATGELCQVSWIPEPYASVGRVVKLERALKQLQRVLWFLPTLTPVLNLFNRRIQLEEPRLAAMIIAAILFDLLAGLRRIRRLPQHRFQVSQPALNPLPMR